MKQIIECRTPNKQFGEIGVIAITRTSVRPLTVGDNPKGVQSTPEAFRAGKSDFKYV